MICESESQRRVTGLTGRNVQILCEIGWRKFVDMVEAMGPYQAEGLTFTYGGTGGVVLVGDRYLLALGAHHRRVSVGVLSREGSAVPRWVCGAGVGEVAWAID